MNFAKAELKIFIFYSKFLSLAILFVMLFTVLVVHSTISSSIRRPSVTPNSFRFMFSTVMVSSFVQQTAMCLHTLLPAPNQGKHSSNVLASYVSLALPVFEFHRVGSQAGCMDNSFRAASILIRR